MSEPRAPLFHRCIRSGWLPEVVTPKMQVMTVSQAVVDLVIDLASRETAAALHALAPLPADHVFIEGPFPHHGAFIVGNGIWVAFEYDGKDEAILFDFDQERRLLVGKEKGGALPLPDERLRRLPWSGSPQIDVSGYYFHTFIALCAALATPGVRTVDEQRREKRLQRSRGQPAPLVTYRCVDINIDELAGIPEQAASGDGEGHAGVARHHVRGHLRLTDKKGLIPVRPHWRGDLRFGLRLRDHNVLRDEEMH